MNNFGELRRFFIIDWLIKSIEPIHYLHNLEVLKVMTYCKTPIRFEEFAHLKKCSLRWRPRSNSIFECATLEELSLDYYSGKSFEPFAHLVRLKEVELFSCPTTTLMGIGELQDLEKIRISSLRQLISLSGLEENKRLKVLWIQGCAKIEALDPICDLKNIQKLVLEDAGSLRSLKPVENFEKLEHLTFTGNTNILDGKLRFLFDLPSLKVISYMNRSHYDVRREEFWERFERNS